MAAANMIAQVLSRLDAMTESPDAGMNAQIATLEALTKVHGSIRWIVGI